MRHKRPIQRMPVEDRRPMTISPQSWTRADSRARCRTVNSCFRLVSPARARPVRHWAIGMRVHGSQMAGRRSAARCCIGALPTLEGGS